MKLAIVKFTSTKHVKIYCVYCDPPSFQYRNILYGYFSYKVTKKKALTGIQKVSHSAELVFH